MNKVDIKQLLESPDVDADGEGIVISYFPDADVSIRRTWAQIFLGYQYDPDHAYNLEQLKDQFEVLEMAEKGVTAVG